MRRHLAQDGFRLAYWHRQQYQIGAVQRIAPVGRVTVDDAEPLRFFKRRDTAADADDLAHGAGMFQGLGERAADQADAADDDLVQGC